MRCLHKNVGKIIHMHPAVRIEGCAKELTARDQDWQRHHVKTTLLRLPE